MQGIIVAISSIGQFSIVTWRSLELYLDVVRHATVVQSTAPLAAASMALSDFSTEYVL